MTARNMNALGRARRLLAFHWALASHMVRGAVVHLQFPPSLRESVHWGRGGQRWAMVGLYMHLKVGRSGETWDQKNKEQCSCSTHSKPLLREALWNQHRLFYVHLICLSWRSNVDPSSLWSPDRRVNPKLYFLVQIKVNWQNKTMYYSLGKKLGCKATSTFWVLWAGWKIKRTGELPNGAKIN